MQNTIKYKVFVLLLAAMASSGCRKIFNLPDEKNYLSTSANYTTKDFDVRLGRTNLTSYIFSYDGSSFPITFEVVNPRFGDGRDASDMLVKRPTLVWKSEYTGTETSLAQIEAKRKLEDHPILEMRGSGDFIFWYTATRDIIKPVDSIVYPQNKRYFDVKLTNSGGSRVIKNLSLTPRIEIPYEPFDDYNTITGLPNTTVPGGKVLKRMNPKIIGTIKGATTNQKMEDPNKATTGLIYVYIRKFTADPEGHRLRIKFLNKDSLPIDPGAFNETKWQDQIHGFNPAGTALGFTKTNTYVEYNVAYPIPLAKIPTKYTAGGVNNTTGGDWAHCEFIFSRVGFGAVRESGGLSQDFKIFEKGDWEIVFHFKNINPKFDND